MDQLKIPRESQIVKFQWKPYEAQRKDNPPISKSYVKDMQRITRVMDRQSRVQQSLRLEGTYSVVPRGKRPFEMEEEVKEACMEACNEMGNIELGKQQSKVQFSIASRISMSLANELETHNSIMSEDFS